MDISPLGAILVSCCLGAVVPPILAAAPFLLMYRARKSQGVPMTPKQEDLVFAALYAAALLATCLYAYFAILQNAYAM